MREQERHYPFDQVWVVFDRDSFPADDFDNAISMAEANQIECAWSNEAFELWYLLHFEYRDTRMPRQEYQRKLTEYLGEKYQKNDTTMYQKTCEPDRQGHATKRAENLYKKARRPWSSANPCTTVFKLVQELNRFILPSAD